MCVVETGRQHRRLARRRRSASHPTDSRGDFYVWVWRVGETESTLVLECTYGARSGSPSNRIYIYLLETYPSCREGKSTSIPCELDAGARPPRRGETYGRHRRHRRLRRTGRLRTEPASSLGGARDRMLLDPPRQTTRLARRRRRGPHLKKTHLVFCGRAPRRIDPNRPPRGERWRFRDDDLRLLRASARRPGTSTSFRGNCTTTSESRPRFPHRVSRSSFFTQPAYHPK